MIPDWGGRHETFEVAILEPPRALVHTDPARTHLRVLGDRAVAVRLRYGPTHVQLRLRLSPVKRKRLAGTAGELLDASTIAGLAAGLRERLTDG